MRSFISFLDEKNISIIGSFRDKKLYIQGQDNEHEKIVETLTTYGVCVKRKFFKEEFSRLSKSQVYRKIGINDFSVAMMEISERGGDVWGS